ncbi:hypothetical protein [Verrucomicrobium spinosum]|uniref:hypothetical protein n=1 Tax=Verrucomicrobium spinosum TaxID=2736 RepID=UPI000AFFFE96|nr:hypothetical protein [Verrucomicrobium spinosum]
MFFARDGRFIDWGAMKGKDAERDAVKKGATDESIEMALFRSASWPYIGNPKGIVAKHAGHYRVRISARAVLQQPGYVLTAAKAPVPLTFRTRKPAGADIINEVRAEGGIIDVQPEKQVYETTIRMREGESFEYSLLGLPMPLARNPNGSAPSYRYPPFPVGGQPGIAVQWLEVEGPLPPPTWPPASHHVLFDDLGIQVKPANASEEAKRLLRRFVTLAAREPVSEEDIARFDASSSSVWTRVPPLSKPCWQATKRSWLPAISSFCASPKPHLTPSPSRPASPISSPTPVPTPACSNSRRRASCRIRRFSEKKLNASSAAPALNVS